jgi:alkaline phosphatase D
MTRKEFITLVAAGSALPAPAVEAAETPSPVLTFIAAASGNAPLTLPEIQTGPAYLMAGPMVGHTGPEEARIWIRATASVPWSVRFAETPSLEGAREVPGPALSGASADTGVAILSGLKPGTRYYYQVLLDGRPQCALPLPSLATAPTPGTKGRLRIAFGSCVGESPANAAAAWGELSARRDLGPEGGGFDLFLLLAGNERAPAGLCHLG